MTNSKTTQCGIYELPKRIIETETGYNRETVEKLIKRFVDYGKVLYSDATKEIMILNWIKYNFINSKNTMLCMNKELQIVKNKEFISMLYSICKDYKYPIEIIFKGLIRGLEAPCKDLGEEEEKEEEKEKEEEIYVSKDTLSKGNAKTPFDDIVSLYNSICTSFPQVTKVTQKRQRLMRNSWKEHKELEVFRKLFSMAQESDFLSGRNGKWTNCNFDWLLAENNMVNILEGKYINRDSIKQQAQSSNNQSNKHKTKFHLANSRGDKYSADELEQLVLNRSKAKIEQSKVGASNECIN
jgi:hypothetical protein